ncbi:hypothetical protein AHAS_Ahas18G0209200 [Arachis hypogaea]
MERQFQQEYTISMFRDVQTEFVKKGDYRVFIVAEEEPSVCMKVEEEKLVNDIILCIPYDVHFDRSTQEVHLYKVPTCYVLPRWSKNIKRKHTDDDKTALLHAVLEETRAKLAAHRTKKRSESMAETHTNIVSQSSNVIGIVNIQGPSKVTTKGRPKSKRLGATLEKSFKKSARRKNKNASPVHVIRPKASQDVNFSADDSRNDPQQAGGFMSLLSSFNKS